MIGIIRLGTIPCGLPHQVRSPSTTHVHPVGVFPMVASLVYGQTLLAQVHLFHILHLTKALTSTISLVHTRASGTRLRVGATATMAASTMSATTATIGPLHLTVPARTFCTTAKARRSTTIARKAGLSVVSKNDWISRLRSSGIVSVTGTLRISSTWSCVLRPVFSSLRLIAGHSRQ